MAVSAVLNGTGRNVKIIRKVAKELRYRPNVLARNLRNRQTNMVAVVFQHFERLGAERPYHAQLLNGVMSALFSANYTLCLCPTLNQGLDAGSVSDGRFDGVLWCRPDFTEASIENIQNSTTPIVILHAPPGAVPGVPSLCADNDGAMAAVVKHLTDLGHERMAFVVDAITEPTVEAQVLVWEEAMPELEDYVGVSRPHTALVCFSDSMAGQVLHRARELGISVPRDLSVVGFDSSPFCETTIPRLTSVSQPVEEMAATATNLLLQLISDANEGVAPGPVISSIYDCGLDIRESTGPASN